MPSTPRPPTTRAEVEELSTIIRELIDAVEALTAEVEEEVVALKANSGLLQ